MRAQALLFIVSAAPAMAFVPQTSMPRCVTTRGSRAKSVRMMAGVPINMPQMPELNVNLDFAKSLDLGKFEFAQTVLAGDTLPLAIGAVAVVALVAGLVAANTMAQTAAAEEQARIEAELRQAQEAAERAERIAVLETKIDEVRTEAQQQIKQIQEEAQARVRSIESEAKTKVQQTLSEASIKVAQVNTQVELTINQLKQEAGMETEIPVNMVDETPQSTES